MAFTMICGVGRLGKDPEWVQPKQKAKNGKDRKPYVYASIAIPTRVAPGKYYFTNLPIIAYGKVAEILMKAYRLRDEILFEGSLRQQTWGFGEKKGAKLVVQIKSLHFTYGSHWSRDPANQPIYPDQDDEENVLQLDDDEVIEDEVGTSACDVENKMPESGVAEPIYKLPDLPPTPDKKVVKKKTKSE